MWGKKFSGGCDLILVMMQLHLCFSISLVLLLPQISKVNSADIKMTSTTTTSSYGNGTFNGRPCNPNALDECWNDKNLPTLKSPNIPTTSKEVEAACNTFKIGMDCVDIYSKACLNPKQRQQVKSTVRGAHETFSFLCIDEKFRAEFLSHSACYKKISGRWDECASHFIESLKKADQRGSGSLSVCCIRLRFLQCVKELANIYCTKEAEKFLLKLAETLVTSNIKNKNATECADVSHVNCSQASGACSPIKFSLLRQPSMLISNIFLNLFPSSVTTTPFGSGCQFCSYFLKLFSLDRISDWVWVSFGKLSFWELSEWVKCAFAR